MLWRHRCRNGGLGELEWARHGGDRQGGSFQVPQPCCPVCLPGHPCILPCLILEQLPHGRT